jgi:hypothetical protein
MKLTPLVATAVLALAGCKKPEPKKEEPAAPKKEEHAAPEEAPAAPAAGPGDCATLQGDNAVQTEMRRLECALQHAIAAIGRDDLAAIPRWIHVVHEARTETEKALESGAYKPTGDLQAFVLLDQTFHGDLEALVEAAAAKDHAGVTGALGRALGQCQGCHGTFRPAGPAAPATTPPAPAPAHDH